MEYAAVINGSYLRVRNETPIKVGEKIDFLEILRNKSQYEIYKGEY